MTIIDSPLHSSKDSFDRVSDEDVIFLYESFREKAKLPRHYGLKKRVIDAITRRILNPEYRKWTIHDVAQDIGTTKRTLQRRLKGQKASFSALYDEVRRYYAVHYLLEQHLTVNDISYALGFSNRTGLLSAFKRWLGISPTALKRLKKEAVRKKNNM